MAQKPWRVELFGGLRLRGFGREIARFQTYKTGALLAYLAFYQERPHSREVLAALLWPEAGPEAGRLSLRVALSSLRHILEPPGIPAGSILVTSRTTVQLNLEAVTTDVAAFEAAILSSSASPYVSGMTPVAPVSGPSSSGIEQLLCIVEQYRGELLTGYYEEWILAERERLNDVYVYALRRLCEKLGEGGDIERAIQYAHRAVAAAPIEEGPRLSLMRLYHEAGRPLDALRQYHQLEKILADEMNEKPSEKVRAYAASLLAQADTPGTASSDLPIRRKSSATPPPPQTSSPSLRPSFARFIGRTEERNRLLSLLHPIPQQDDAPSRRRLITLTGTGGTGKTRLALEVARGVADEYQGAVYFVSLAEISEPEFIGEAILEAISSPRDPHLTALEQIVKQSATASILLVLDNFEHLAETGSGIVLSLLRRLPYLICLVTSRRRLMLPGEQEFPVSLLPTPVSKTCHPEELLAFESVQLFVEYAQAARPDFQVTVRNAPSVATLCSLLEGLPLALEMAAARITVFTPAQIVLALQKGRETLVTTLSSRKDKPARQNSLWSTLDWSFRLLSPELQHFFVRLSVFRGSWSVTAAEFICKTPGNREREEAISSSRTVEHLTSLRSHSLITVEEAEDEIRFRMLETVRAFGASHLSLDEQTGLAQQHALYYLALTQEAGTRLRGPEQSVRLQQITREYDNLRAALQHCIEHDVGTALQLCCALGDYWVIRGHMVEGRAWTERALASQGLEAASLASLRLRALNTLASITVQQGYPGAAAATLSEALQLASGEEDLAARSQTLYLQGFLLLDLGAYEEARSCYEESLSIRERIEDKSGAAYARVNLGEIALRQGDYRTANLFWEQAIRQFEEIQDRRGFSLTLANLGQLAYYQGDYTLAREHGEQSLTVLLDLQLPCNSVYHFLGSVAYATADLTAARDYFERSLIGYQEQNSRKAIGLAQLGLAEVCNARGENEAALELYTCALQHCRETEGRAEEADALLGLARLVFKHQEKEKARLLLQEALTIHQEIGNWRGVARALEQAAFLMVAEGRDFSGAQMVFAAKWLRESILYPLCPIEKPEVQGLLQMACDRLGGTHSESAFVLAEKMSQEMSRTEAVSFAIRELSLVATRA